jgi:oligosaccharyltransferase complex subunit beta
VYFATEIWQWDSDSDKWVPFNAPEGDILMEFVMLDPYYRIPLKQNAKEPAKYEVEFKIPDKYGIFHFRVNYFRPGYSFLRIAEKVPFPLRGR